MLAAPPPRRAAGATPLAAALALAAAPAAQTVPDGFEVVPVVEGLNRAVDLEFTPDGRLLVITQKGTVRVHDGTALQPEPFLDLTDEVNLNGERGLLGIAVHPGFAPDGGPTSWVYLLYTVSPVPGEDWDWDENDQFSFSRLTRYRAVTGPAGLVADAASRQVLLGSQAPDGSVPDGIASLHLSHSNGSLVFGADGSLLVATGDGAHFDFADLGGADPPGFDDWLHPITGLVGPTPAVQDSGSFRSRDPRSLAGKILRIDPETGDGYPSNPFFDGDPSSNPSRVWATGLRNPYRAALLPGTGAGDPALGAPGALLVGDVGLSGWEELNLCAGGEDLGWPCREGLDPLPQFDAHDPADPDFPDCLAAVGGPLAGPLVAYSHADPALAHPPGVYEDEDGTPLEGYTGVCTVGAAVYPGGGYPDAYDGRVFFADFGAGWIQTLELDAAHDVVAVRPFATGFATPVALAAHPITGDVHVVGLFGPSVAKIRYVAPDAVATYGCASPAGSLAAVQPLAAPGETLELEVHNPLGTQAPGSLTALGVSAAPDPAFPCGAPAPGFGMAGFGAVGELLIDPGPGAYLGAVVGPTWTGAPATIPLAVPYLLTLVGRDVYVQGLLFDPTAPGPGANAAFALTEGVHLVLGS